jgi:hypothetical protein
MLSAVKSQARSSKSETNPKARNTRNSKRPHDWSPQPYRSQQSAAVWPSVTISIWRADFPRRPASLDRPGARSALATGTIARWPVSFGGRRNPHPSSTAPIHEPAEYTDHAQEPPTTGFSAPLAPRRSIDPCPGYPRRRNVVICPIQSTKSEIRNKFKSPEHPNPRCSDEPLPRLPTTSRRYGRIPFCATHTPAPVRQLVHKHPTAVAQAGSLLDGGLLIRSPFIAPAASLAVRWTLEGPWGASAAGQSVSAACRNHLPSFELRASSSQLPSP